MTAVGDHQLETYFPVSNDGAPIIEKGMPYVAFLTVEGTAPLLFHRWSVEAIEEKAEAPRGSDTKKTDNVESYVARADNGDLAIPTEYFRQSLIGAARFKSDPRSARKTAMDLFKAGLATEEELCPLGTDEWDYLDRRRVQVQRQGVTRTRPAMKKGWRVTVPILVLLPEYIDPQLLNAVMQDAGRLIGVGDYRPSYGRFQIIGFEVRAA